MSEFERILDIECQLGESPVWSRDQGVLIFVDIKGRKIHRFNPKSGELQSHSTAEDIGCIAPSKEGGYVAGMRSGIWLLNENGGKTIMLAANPEETSASRFNDGRVDPRGRFVAGTIDEPKAGGRANLYRCDHRGLARLSTGLMTSNGVAFSPDGKTLYSSDTPRFVIYRYDYDPETGEAVNRRVFAQLQPVGSDRGRPDGAAMDSEGCYWSSLYEGGRIARFDPEGHLMSEHAVPVRAPTMPAFGGDDMRMLFVTTASDASGGRGNLYAMPVDVPGIASPPFDPQI